MDPQQFDRITRALAIGTDRRRAVRGLLGAALGTAFGLRHVSSRAQACSPVGQACDAQTPCCGEASGKVVCAPIGRCQHVAGCAAGQLRCSGACIDPLTDEANCGACGNACTGGGVCLGGRCTPCSRCGAVVECGGDGFCGADGQVQCIPMPTSTGSCSCVNTCGGRFATGPSPCPNGDECPEGIPCVDGFCGGHECQVDADCGPGFACVSGQRFVDEGDPGLVCSEWFNMANVCYPLCPRPR